MGCVCFSKVPYIFIACRDGLYLLRSYHDSFSHVPMLSAAQVDISQLSRGMECLFCLYSCKISRIGFFFCLFYRVDWYLEMYSIQLFMTLWVLEHVRNLYFYALLDMLPLVTSLISELDMFMKFLNSLFQNSITSWSCWSAIHILISVAGRL